VRELMFIENSARKLIYKAIQCEQILTNYETVEYSKGKVILSKKEYNNMRSQFIAILCTINAVANYEVKGRDDLTVDILICAEHASRTISSVESQAVRKLA